jgi:hypothetical protein
VQKTIEVISPVAPRAATAGGGERVDRVRTLAGGVVGLLDNSKTNAGVLLRAVGSRLQAELGVASTTLVDKRSDPSGPLSPDDLRRLARARLVVGALGN